MTPDVNIKNFYLQFIYGATVNIKEYNEILDKIIAIKEKSYNYINEHKDIIKEQFNIDVDKYIEFKDKIYNNTEQLYNKITRIFKKLDNTDNKLIIIQIIKYCNMLRNEHRYNILINLANKRKNIKFNEYRKYVNDYYVQVHKCVLSGMGYKFTNGIGTYIINHWKLNSDKIKKKKHIDYAATNARKKELIKQGVKLYDEKEALWYKSRNIPYNAVDYRIYQDKLDWYEFTFIKSRIVRKSILEYKHPEYVAAKYRGMSYKQMADQLCKTEEDIYNLQVDIKYKLNILLYKYPEKYINFIRNADECKYKYRENNS